jgi:hypothetical protein
MKIEMTESELSTLSNMSVGEEKKIGGITICVCADEEGEAESVPIQQKSSTPSEESPAVSAVKSKNPFARR